MDHITERLEQLAKTRVAVINARTELETLRAFAPDPGCAVGISGGVGGTEEIGGAVTLGGGLDRATILQEAGKLLHIADALLASLAPKATAL
jgi:hypothetical protein